MSGLSEEILYCPLFNACDEIVFVNDEPQHVRNTDAVL